MWQCAQSSIILNQPVHRPLSVFRFRARSLLWTAASALNGQSVAQTDFCILHKNNLF